MKKSCLFIVVFALSFLTACAEKEVRMEAPAEDATDKPVIEQIQDRLRARTPEIAECYEKNVKPSSKKGKSLQPAEVMTQFALDANGKVKSVKITQSTLKNKKAEDCIKSVIRSTSYPKPESPAGLEITYPFKFTPESEAAPGVGG